MLFELSSPSFATRPLTDDDALELQALLETCADYFRVVLGRDPGPAEALGIFYAGPEAGQSPDNKILLGITAPGSRGLVGVLDAFADYPAKGVWYIGLLLLVPRARRGGLGAKVIEQLAVVARRAGARELQLNVVEQNEPAHAFWSRHGFVERRRWLQHFGNRQSVFIRMARTLEEENQPTMMPVAHFEIHALDTQAIGKFYSDIFGWKISKWDGPSDYWLVSAKTEGIGIDGGIVKRQTGAPAQGAPANAYVCTIAVDSIERVMQQVVARGGQIVLEKREVPTIGWLAYAQDPEGNTFGILQPQG